MGFRPDYISKEKLHNINSIWVFGYGSILWKTGFKYSRRKLGYVKGFVRRFWQGNTTHRGTPEQPGRVATLVECDSGEVWGAAYELVGEKQIEAALDHLGMRECKLGGYKVKTLNFHPTESNCSQSECKCCVLPSLVFIATCQNPHYMGPASVNQLASQVISARGPSGHNVEYVLRLAIFLKDKFPEHDDQHLYGLERQVRALLQQEGKSFRRNPAGHFEVVTLPSEIPRDRSRANSWCESQVETLHAHLQAISL